ncbi:hypothetical protein Tco_0975840 [Tanacetum coccineum]|uniref:Uncharacterized protein n=1 Tax=Tanacetum coccineum TaxID=301880 RepID=A0ABQ5EFI7_9ASTR
MSSWKIPESSYTTLSSMKNLDEIDNFTDQFLNYKPTEDDQEKTNVVDETDSIIPDPSHQTNTSAPLVTAPVINISSPRPSSQVNAPPINTEATAIIITILEITLFIAFQLRVAKLEQDMSEVKKTDRSAAVLASIQSQVPTVVDKFLGTKVDALLNALEKHTAYLIQKYSRLHAPESSKKQESKKSPEEILIIKREQEEQKHVPTYTIKKRKLLTRLKTIKESLIVMMMRLNDGRPSQQDSKPGTTASAWKITNTRDAPSGSLMPRFEPQSKQSSYDIQIQNKEQDHISDSDDNYISHFPRYQSITSWFQSNTGRQTRRKTDQNGPFLQMITLDQRTTGKMYMSQRKNKLCKADLEGPTFNLVKSFHKNSVSFLFQMDECYKLLTDKVDLVNLEGHQILRNVYEPLPLGGHHAVSNSIRAWRPGNGLRTTKEGLKTLSSYERSHKGVKASANSDIVYFFISAQDGNTLQDDERLDLADDLMKAQVHNQRQVNEYQKDH